MANEEQLSILKQGVEVWNKWRQDNSDAKIDLRETNLSGAKLMRAHLAEADLTGADLLSIDVSGANLEEAVLIGVDLRLANLKVANLHRANLTGSDLWKADFRNAVLSGANLTRAAFSGSQLAECSFFMAEMRDTVFSNSDLSKSIGLEDVIHRGPSNLGIETLYVSKGKIPEVFLRGCGLTDWQIESAKLHNPALSNEDINKILYKMYDLRAGQALQLSPLFISYSHSDSAFVDMLETYLDRKGVRFWRDVHDATSGRLEKVVDRAMRLNPTVLLILSEHSIKSDWVEHEVRIARELEKEMGRDVLCPVAMDNSWKSSRWPKRVMEQIIEYNILDFSEWEDDVKFEGMFRKLIDGLELFYKG